MITPVTVKTRPRDRNAQNNPVHFGGQNLCSSVYYKAKMLIDRILYRQILVQLTVFKVNLNAVVLSSSKGAWQRCAFRNEDVGHDSGGHDICKDCKEML